MFSSFSGWHLMIVLAVVIIPIAVIALVVWLVVRAARSPGTAARASLQQAPAQQPSASPDASTPDASAPDASARLAQLDELRAAGRISDAEYEAKRAQILDEL